MPTPPGFDDEVRALYHGPLGEFTAARQVLARRLRKAGDPRAAEIAAAGKPSVSAWAVNALFAQEARAIAAFVEAGDRARASAARAAAGDAAPLRAAIATLRDETPRLLARAVELLTAAERAPGEAIVERIRTNLDALALDPATAAVAARGWLDEDLAPPGFEIMAALQLAAAGVKTAPPAPAPPSATGKAGALPSTASRRAVAPKPAAPPAPPPRPLATVTRFADAAERRAAAERAAQENRERREREQREREQQTRRERLRTEAAEAERVAAEQRATAEAAAAAAERAVKEAEAAQRAAAEAQARARETRQTAIAAEAVARRARAALERAGKE